MIKPNIIAIDGPAASGKSTLGEKLAQELKYLYLDTGIMYRAVTLAILKSQMSVYDEEKVSNFAQKLRIDVRPSSVFDGRKNDVLLNGEDVTKSIRSPEIDQNVSVVSAYRLVRKAMTEQQQQIGRRGKIVMVGRDIGTVVLPEANLKIFLDASLGERARRRFEELSQKGVNISYKNVLESLEKRDQIDKTRDLAPLYAAQDALVINSDGMTIQEVFNFVLTKITD